MKVGDLVNEKKHGHCGVIQEVFENWGDLKSKKEFLTIDPENESDEIDVVEKLINGDPKDGWLKMQSIPFTDGQLNERWYSVKTYNGGSIWSCESRLQLVN